MVGSTRVKDRVIQYLAKHPGVVVFRDDISSDLGVTVEQVSNAVRSIFGARGDAAYHIRVVEPARAWRWVDTIPSTVGAVPTPPPSAMAAAVVAKATEPARPELPQSKHLYEELAALPDGRILVRGDSGGVFWLTPLEASV